MVFDLSIATIDIEAWTKKFNKSVQTKKIENFSYVGLKNEAVAVQEISLIGYADSFSQPTYYKDFQVQSNTIAKNAKIAVGHLIDHILRRQKVISDLKQHLLKPFYDFVARYKKAHFTFWNREFDQQILNNQQKETQLSQIEFSFANSLIGQFEKHLHKLRDCLYNYTFNGGKYDLILLHKLICVHLKTIGFNRPLHIIKRSSRIVRLSIPKTGIKFVDICDIIGMESSLDKFAKLTGQTESKLVFPFSCFTSPEFLLQTKLPENDKDWYNDLKQCYYTTTEINRARDDFKRHNCKNIGEYLKIYLKMDCELLGLGVIKYFKSLYHKFGVHPLDVDKTTIASYGGYLLQRNLMINKRIAQFSPNVLPMYGCLKSASTGGLTMVSRHSADSSNVDEDFINSYLSSEHNIKGQGVVSWDVRSLYPSAALRKLPFGPGIFTMKCKTNEQMQNSNNLHMTNCFDKYSCNLLNSSESQVIQYLTLVHYAKALRVFSNFHAGVGQVCFGKSHKKRVDLFIVDKTPGDIKIIQYHDSASHVGDKNKHDVNCQYNKQGTNIEYNKITTISDDQNARYAAYITANVAEINITYKIYNECEFFHNDIVINGISYPSLKLYLEKFYPEDSVFKPEWLECSFFTTETLLNQILYTDKCDAGFVVIKKGAKECANDEIEKLFAFCLQKCSPLPQELGEEAKVLAKQIVVRQIIQRNNETNQSFNARIDIAVDKYLKDRVKTQFTLTRKSFIHDQCLPVPYFKWLVQNRNILPSVDILHYIHYEGRNYASNFIHSILQDRHNLILSGKKGSLEAAICKLLANSLYGQTLMEKCKYHRYTYALDKNLHKKSLLSAVNINLIGAIPNCQDKYNLLYLLKYSQNKVKISNLLHVGACILGNSRVIFYNHLYKLLKVLDSRKAELCYIDTDSCFFYLASPNLIDCVKQNEIENFNEISKHIFEDTTSKDAQCGKLKLEGWHKSGFFRCVKSYVLNPFSNDEERIVKYKGIAKLIRTKMSEEAFYVNNRKRKNPNNDQKYDKMFFQNLTLHPTIGEQIFMSVKRKKLSNPINCKRIMIQV